MIRWPKKPSQKQVVIEYLSTKFDSDKNYSEKEINLAMSHLSFIAHAFMWGGNKPEKILPEAQIPAKSTPFIAGQRADTASFSDNRFP